MGPLLVQAKIRGEGQAWARLIAQTAQGDQAAFGTMYDKTSVRIYDLILRILGDRASAEEVTIDVFTQVWRDARRYNSDRGSPASWLLTMARSRAIDRLRAGKAERPSKQRRRYPTRARTRNSPVSGMSNSVLCTIVRSPPNWYCLWARSRPGSDWE